MLQAEAKRLGMTNARADSYMIKSVSEKQGFAMPNAKNNESEYGHLRASEDAEEAALRQRVAYLEAQVADLEKLDAQL